MQFKAMKDVPILNNAPYDQAYHQPADSGYVGKYSAAAPQPSAPVYSEQPEQTFAPTPQEQPVYHGAHEADGTSGGRVFRSNSSISSFKKANVDDILNGDPIARASSAPAEKPAPAPAAPEKKPASSSPARSRSAIDNASVDDLLAMIERQKKNL